jgi:hypothetical protein
MIDSGHAHAVADSPIVAASVGNAAVSGDTSVRHCVVARWVSHDIFATDTTQRSLPLLLL